MQLTTAGLAVQVENVPAGAFGAVIDRLAPQIAQALRQHPILRENVSHVGGGAFYAPDEPDSGGIGFKLTG